MLKPQNIPIDAENIEEIRKPRVAKKIDKHTLKTHITRRKRPGMFKTDHGLI